MNDSSVSTHINLITLKVVDIDESEEFYDLLHDQIGLVKKDKNDDGIVYWGAFGIQLIEQNNIIQNIEAKSRIGMVKISIRVPKTELIDSLVKLLKSNNFKVLWDPKPFAYAPGYYSACLLDPDDNELEIVYLD